MDFGVENSFEVDQDQLEWVIRQRLNATTPTPVAAEDAQLLQDHPQVVGDLQQLKIPYRNRTAGHDKRQTNKDLTRDQKLEIRTLKKFYPESTYQSIADRTGYKYHQIQHSLTTKLTPQKKGPQSWALKNLTPEEKQQLIQWIYNCEPNRYQTWNDIRYIVPGLDQYGETVLYRTLSDMGFRREVRQQRKLPLSCRDEEFRCENCEDWLAAWPNPWDWVERGPVFSDETYGTTDPCFKQWFTCHRLEDPRDHWYRKTQEYHGWMFWGCIRGRHKGPCYIWPKGEGKINSFKYSTRILPLVRNFMDEFPDEPVFQHDGAPSHTSNLTREVLDYLEIYAIEWPPNSPDLNPIENCWARIKAWIEINYNIDWVLDQDQTVLFSILFEAWEKAITEDYLVALALSQYNRVKQCVQEGGRQQLR
ncbi:putative Tc1-like transposase DDE domain-containing protein [Seiridium cardinale]|uniref:Tc1-like transposase DDE domain-containing protein n=1 Tax=Seiridium cardinale TaxID=138064 RepID=A0ABR2X6M0_9PEZI